MDLNQNTNSRISYHYIDRLRVLLVGLVIAHHAGQAYGSTGGDWPVFEVERTVVLGPFFTVNAGFFMGFFFLISGLFLAGSLERKGIKQFMSDRLIRLGIPLLVIGFGVFAFIGYTETDENAGFWSYFFDSYIGNWQVYYGPLWFVFHLLIYSVAYALLAQIIPALLIRSDQPLPRPLFISVFVIALAVITGITSLLFDHNTWINIFGILPSEPIHLPQYIALFIVGTIAGRQRWIENTSVESGMQWLKIGLGCSVFWYILSYASIFAGFRLNQGVWFKIFFPFWESLLCVSLSIGLLIFAREHWASASPWWKRLSEAAYGAYVVHVFIIVGLNLVFLNLSLQSFTKFLLVFVIALIVSFMNAMLLRKLPLISRVL